MPEHDQQRQNDRCCASPCGQPDAERSVFSLRRRGAAARCVPARLQIRSWKDFIAKIDLRLIVSKYQTLVFRLCGGFIHSFSAQKPI